MKNGKNNCFRCGDSKKQIKLTPTKKYWPQTIKCGKCGYRYCDSKKFATHVKTVNEAIKKHYSPGVTKK